MATQSVSSVASGRSVSHYVIAACTDRIKINSVWTAPLDSRGANGNMAARSCTGAFLLFISSLFISSQPTSFRTNRVRCSDWSHRRLTGSCAAKRPGSPRLRPIAVHTVQTK